VPADDRKRGFLIMPFSDELNWLHEEIMEASLAEKVTTRRADNIFKPGAILQQIFDEIDEADLIFAVCTGRNANVFFELGYAWREHSPILIAEDTHDLPFDLSAFRTELYGRDVPSADRHSLQLRLRKAIRASLDDERIPRGRRLMRAPKVKQATRLSATLQDNGRNHNLVVTNSGNVELRNVDVEVPEDVKRGFHMHTEGDLPVDVLRPGESVKFPVSLTMGLGRRIFDITLRGDEPGGDALEFPCKISV
jgi:hypothetical protein